MNGLEILTVTALAAVTVGTGALAAAPSASAAHSLQPQRTAKIASTAEWPKICFKFGPWTYCI
jgi:invasion protein IalB